MKIKKYEVTDMKEALRLIKQELGPDAVILTTRKIMKPAGLGLFPKPLLEVTAAANYNKDNPKRTASMDSKNVEFPVREDSSYKDDHIRSPYLPPEPTRKSSLNSPVTNDVISASKADRLPDSYPPGSYYSSNENGAIRYSPPEVTEEPKARRVVEDTVRIVQKDLTDKGVREIVFEEKSYEPESDFTKSLLSGQKLNTIKSPESVDSSSSYINSSINKSSVDNTSFSSQPSSYTRFSGGEGLETVLSTMGLSSIATDISDIKKQLNDMKSSMQKPINISVDLAPNLRDIYSVMIKNGVDELIGYRLLKGVESNISESTPKMQIKTFLTDRIASSIPMETNYLSLMKNKIMGFIGPTGVGKTTTIAKIAAELVLRHTQKVCLITVDNFRVGAVEQLKTYAEIVNLPLYVASSANDLERLLKNVAGKYEYTLLDSTGRSPYDSNKLNETAQYLSASVDIVPVLVLSMAANHSELGEMYERYSGLEPRFLVFTKLDETRYFGPLANLPIKKKVPLMLLSVGQSVPDDLEIPSGEKIAKKILQEIPALWNDN